MRIEPAYIEFKNRIFFQIRESYLIFLIIAVTAAIFSSISAGKLLITLSAVYLLFLIQAYFYNKYCLKYIDVDETDKTVRICIYKYNKCFSEQEIPISKIKVKIYRIIYSLLPWYKLMIFNKDEKLISQVETRMWKLSDFKKIIDKT